MGRTQKGNDSPTTCNPGAILLRTLQCVSSARDISGRLTIFTVTAGIRRRHIRSFTAHIRHLCVLEGDGRRFLDAADLTLDWRPLWTLLKNDLQVDTKNTRYVYMTFWSILYKLEASHFTVPFWTWPRTARSSLTPMTSPKC